MKIVKSVGLVGAICALTIGISCSRTPFVMVDVKNLWEDNYSTMANDSTYWPNSKTYNVQDPAVRLIDDTFYLFSTDVVYMDMKTFFNSGRGGSDNNRMGRGGPGGGFPGFPGMEFGNQNSKSKDRVAQNRERRNKLRAAARGEDTTTVVEEPAVPQGMGGMFPGGFGGDTTGMAARRAAMANGMRQGRGERGSMQGGPQQGGPQQGRGQQGADRGSNRGGNRDGNAQQGGAPQGGFGGFGPMGGGMPNFGDFAAWGRGMRGGQTKIGNGFIQRRKSVDLANWEFAGWVFDSIPADAAAWMKGVQGPPVNTTKAPFVMEYDGEIRLYYNLASRGMGPAYIGLATAKSVYGPWEDKGCVLQSNFESDFAAVDPSVVEHDGKLYMYYGSARSGVYCVELNAQSGMIAKKDDYGVCVAKGVEAPEVIYNDESKKFYLFCSVGNNRGEYFTRVGCSDNPTGPFVDFNGNPITKNSLPEILNPYKFDKHEGGGWIGLGSVSVFQDDNSDWYIAHNGRLKSDAGIMDLHVRKMVFSGEDWPMVMPERFAGEEDFNFTTDEVCGGYEILYFNGTDSIPVKYVNIEIVEEDWSFNERDQVLNLTLWNGTPLDGLHVYPGHDWERGSTTIQFVTIDKNGHTVWGKRVD